MISSDPSDLPKAPPQKPATCKLRVRPLTQGFLGHIRPRALTLQTLPERQGCVGLKETQSGPRENQDWTRGT